jgi:hypothetical protein
MELEFGYLRQKQLIYVTLIKKMQLNLELITRKANSSLLWLLLLLVLLFSHFSITIPIKHIVIRNKI